MNENITQISKIISKSKVKKEDILTLVDDSKNVSIFGIVEYRNMLSGLQEETGCDSFSSVTFTVHSVIETALGTMVSFSEEGKYYPAIIFQRKFDEESEEEVVYLSLNEIAKTIKLFIDQYEKEGAISDFEYFYSSELNSFELDGHNWLLTIKPKALDS